MKSEKRLLQRFNEILDEINQIANKAYFEDWARTGRIGRNPGRDEFLRKIREKIVELETLGIEKIKLEEAIQRILEKVGEDIRKILTSSQLTETEKRIRRLLEQMKGDPEHSHPQAYQKGREYLTTLEHLSVAEEDLIQAKERILKIMEKLVKAAEELD